MTQGRRKSRLDRPQKPNVPSVQYISEIRLKREEVESFEHYPFSLAAVRPLERLELHPAVTLVGSYKRLTSIKVSNMLDTAK